MEIERAIISALNEGRSFQNLYQKASKLRKEKKLGLGRTDFNKALKRLIKDNIIIAENVNKREKRYSLSKQEDSARRLEIMGILKEEDSKLDKIEEFVQAARDQATFLKNNKISNKKKIIQKSQDVILEYIHILLSRHKLLSFLVDSAWDFPITKRELKFQQKRCVKLKNELSHISKDIDVQSSGSILFTILNDISKEMDKHIENGEKAAKYFMK